MAGIAGPRASGFYGMGLAGCDLLAAWKLLRPRSRVTPTSSRSSSTTCGRRRAGPRPRSAPTGRGRKRSWAGSARKRTRLPTSRLPTSTDTWAQKALPAVAAVSPCGTTCRHCGRSSGLPNVEAGGHPDCPRPSQLRVCIGTRDCLWGPPQTTSDACLRPRKETAPRTCAIGQCCSCSPATGCALAKCAACDWTISTGRRRRFACADQRPAAPPCSRCPADSGTPCCATCARLARTAAIARLVREIWSGIVPQLRKLGLLQEGLSWRSVSRSRR